MGGRYKCFLLCTLHYIDPALALCPLGNKSLLPLPNFSFPYLASQVFCSPSAYDSAAAEVWKPSSKYLSSTPASPLHPYICFELNLFTYHVCPLPFAYSQPTCLQSISSNSNSVHFSWIIIFFSLRAYYLLGLFGALGVLH